MVLKMINMIFDNNIQNIKKSDFDGTFLERLKFFNDCPGEINYLGNLDFFKNEKKYILMVGSRKHSKYSEEALEKIISELGGYDLILISGLALGIDSLVHKLALKFNLKTIAIPGSGLSKEVLYPGSNFYLAEEILKKNGLLISKFDNNFRAQKWSFPSRNSLMVELADFVLIVEAGLNSGTLITANMAIEKGKDLGVVPGSIFSEFSKGSNKLLKEGAIPIFSGNDILEYFDLDLESLPKQKNFFEEFELTEMEKKVIGLLKEPKSKEEILMEINIEMKELNVIISLLEMKGLIKKYLNKYRIK